LPDQVTISDGPNLPTNILGVFDHEQNHQVPTALVGWRLAAWPIGNDIQAGFINDPEFLTNWTATSLNTYPTELNPTDTTNSGLTRVGVAGIGINPATLLPTQWFEANDLAEDDGDAMAASTYSNKGSLGGLLIADSARDMPIVRTNALNGRKAVETDGNMPIEFDNFSSIAQGEAYTVIAVYRGPDNNPNLSLMLGADADAGAGNNRGIEFPRQQVAANAAALYGTGSEGDISDTFDNTDTLATSGGYHITIIRRENANPLAGRHWVHHDGVNITPSVPVTFANDTLNFQDIFSAGSTGPAYSASGTQCMEVFVFETLLTDTQIEDSWQFLSEKYFALGQADVDVLEIYAGSGVTQGIEQSFALEENDVATWTYAVRGDTGPAGVVETFTAASGTIDIDVGLSGVWTTIANGTSSINTYQVTSGVPGETAWSTLNDGYWLITRRVRSTVANAYCKLSLQLTGETLGGRQSIFVDSFDLTKQNSVSSKFEYCAEPILGLNWDGRGTHVRDENLFQFSDDMLLWQSSGLTRTIDTDTDSRIRLSGASGYIYQSISGADLLDNTFTLTWQSFAPSSTSGQVTVIQDTVLQNFDWTINTQETSGVILFSGIVRETGANLQVRWQLWGTEALISKPQLVHGSGIVDYLGTSSESVKKYRRVIAPVSTQTVDTAWASGYAQVEGAIITTTQSGTIRSDGSVWAVASTQGFPDQGVIRIGGQEYGYRNRTSGQFNDTLVGWRGTPYNVSAITSGSNVLNVPIPQSITSIDPTTKQITFRDTIPAPLGDWANSVNMQIYNTHVSNLDRFSLQTSAVPVTRAAGNLLTAFIHHVSDHRRHFRLSQLCGQIIDSSAWASSPVIVANLGLVDTTVQELTEYAQLNVEAKRFVPTSDKEVIISWGDGTTTTVSGAQNTFLGNSHIYDLKQIADTTTYTISVVIKDEDLGFSRQASITINVRPKINPAGQSTKSTVRASAKIQLPGSVNMKARAKIKDQNTHVTTARAKMVL